jgi:hypothetical protein
MAKIVCIIKYTWSPVNLYYCYSTKPRMDRQLLTLKDGRTFEFFTSFVNIKNPLGAIRATLKEYTLSETSSEEEKTIYKLYKTKDGYWYDHPSAERPNPLLIMVLKAALDEMEKKELLKHSPSSDAEKAFSE